MRRKLTAVGAALVVVAVLLVGLEVVLRALGLGAPPPGLDSGLVYQRVWLPALEPGELADGRAVLRTVDPRLPFQWVAPEKPEGTLRIFCFGGSASAGLGFSPNVTFARYLEELLLTAYPGRDIEVINLGMVALPSGGVRWLVRDALARYEPDLVVVYSGNNEFLEVHSEHFFRATASLPKRLMHDLEGTHLLGLLRGHRGGERPSITTRDLAENDEEVRVSHREMLREVVLDPDEERGTYESYEANLTEMARAARAAEVPLVLCTVATNWRWWGLEDPEGGWLEELVPGAASGAPELLEQARAAVDGQLAGGELDAHGAHLWLYRRAQLDERLGDFEAARDDYLRATDLDPHLRRATSEHARIVRRVAAREGVALYDSIEDLGARAEHGILGFEQLYDYVHFTPRGALELALGLLAQMRELELVPVAPGFDGEAFLALELARLEALIEDELDVGRWTGVALDVSRFDDRNLWKYDRAHDELDRHLEANPSDARARVHRGNAHFFLQGGLGDAEADYRAALAHEDLPAARANLELLLGDRRARRR